MLLVGLTGNIASGKSTVARSFAERGATIIDADVLARRAVQLGTPAHAAIVRRWGDAVLAPDGLIDRAALRERVFTDHDELEELNAIVHPEVARLRAGLLAEARKRGDRIVVSDIPLLFERHLAGEFDRIVLVDAPRTARLERLVRDRRLREDEAMNMITAQMPAELKRARADFVIDNGGSRAELEAHVARVWSALEAEAGGAALTVGATRRATAREAASADAEVDIVPGIDAPPVDLRRDSATRDSATRDSATRDSATRDSATRDVGGRPAEPRGGRTPSVPEPHPRARS
jgi:dephospho-CoA kinase